MNINGISIKLDNNYNIPSEEDEIWKKYEINGYYVSNKGRIYCKNDKYEGFKTPYIKENGYLQIDLKTNNKRYKRYVHRMVAETFIVNSNNYNTVNHKNNIKTDNTVDNLEWMDGKYNTHIAYNKEVCQLSLDGKLITIHDNPRSAAKNINKLSCYSSIIACLNKVPYYKTACGFKWIYKEEYYKI